MKNHIYNMTNKSYLAQELNKYMVDKVELNARIFNIS